uniref:Uncharacterized protein n=1 Tax=Bursaphelenchus xylophilus TaxID=6326 RepID=A0A1I7RYD8_BURXY
MGTPDGKTSWTTKDPMERRHDSTLQIFKIGIRDCHGSGAGSWLRLRAAPAPSREPEPEPEILGSAPAPEPKVGARLPSGQKSKNFVVLLIQIA